ncbi:MAG: HigA family addiction module antidote protein [Melioribacteraceae bacterium]|nr:HigA family addiction module antidote protein [Melioribacteraceae bacterium]
MTKEIHSDLPIPPGEFLEEVLDDLGMGKEELARRMDRPPNKLSPIFKGEKAITPDTALRLEKVTGVPAHIWSGLEAEYRLTLARLQEKKELEKRKKETPLIKKYCYNELASFHYVERKTKPIDKVEELQKFFGVTSLFNLDNVKRYQSLFKQNLNKRSKVSSEAIISWLRMGENKAHKIDTAEFKSPALKNLLPYLRTLTKKSPSEFQKKMTKKFADAGVAFVIVPHLPKTYAHGAAFWLNEKAVIMNTIRGSWADIFWFSLFHEIAHLLLHSKNQVFIESDKKKFISEKLEAEANEFAADNLIDPKTYKNFIKENSFFKQDIIKFADELKIHPGIVVGRLQHDGLIDPSWHNDLREKYIWE